MFAALAIVVKYDSRTTNTKLHVILERIKRKRTEQYSLVKSTAARAHGIFLESGATAARGSGNSPARRRDEFARTIFTIDLARFDLELDFTATRFCCAPLLLRLAGCV